MSKIKKFIDAIDNDDRAKAQETFDQIIRSKVNEVLDIKKIAITAEIFDKR